MQSPLCATQLREQRLWGDHPNAMMLTDGKQMPVIAGDEHVHLRLNRASEDQVIVRVSRHRLGWSLGRSNHPGRKVDQKLLDALPALWLEAQLPGKDPLQLDHHRLGQDELQAGVDCLLEDPARRTGGDERRDQDVGVAGDSQDQLRPERVSSTRASLSSGPIPSASARSRP